MCVLHRTRLNEASNELLTQREGLRNKNHTTKVLQACARVSPRVATVPSVLASRSRSVSRDSTRHLR